MIKSYQNRQLRKTAFMGKITECTMVGDMGLPADWKNDVFWK